MQQGLYVYGGEGTLKNRRGAYRIVVLARSKNEARDILGASDEAMLFYRVSRLPHELALFTNEETLIGDIFAAPKGTCRYEPVDAEDVEA